MEEPLLSRAYSGRAPVIAVRLDELWEEYNATRRSQWLRWPKSDALSRCYNSSRFCLSFTAAAAAEAAPPGLAVAEALITLLVYALEVRGSIFHPSRHSESDHYQYSASAEDLVALSIIRCVTVLTLHVAAPWAVYRRPYLLASAAYSCFTVPFAAAKIAAIKHGASPRKHWPPLLALCALQICFSVVQVVAAQGALAYARKRWRMGLSELHSEGRAQESWALSSPAAGAAEGLTTERDGDVLPEQLADADSLFMTFPADRRRPPLTVHYKVGLPCDTSHEAGQYAGVVLIHSYGAGVHAWRHLMQPLADAAGVAVVAFDRPGFGFTSRPAFPSDCSLPDNPYSTACHARLAIELAGRLGLRRVLLAGAEDGALVALMAAAASLQPTNGLAGGPMGGAGAHAATGTPPPSPSSSMSGAGSLDLAWMGSATSPASRKALLQRLLHGDFSLTSPGPATPLAMSRAPSPAPPEVAAMARGSSGHVGSMQRAGLDDVFALDLETGLSGQSPTKPGKAARRAHHHRVSSVASAADAEGAAPRERPPHPALSTGGSAGAALEVVALALLHPDLSGMCGSSRFVRVLSCSQLGRRVLRDLLAAEVGAVSNRRAWADDAALTPELLALYRRPLHCVGWDSALVGVSMANPRLPSQHVQALVTAVGKRRQGAPPPVLVLVGASDRLTPPEARALAQRFPSGQAKVEVLQCCGRLSYEERPAALTAALAALARQAFAV